MANVDGVLPSVPDLRPSPNPLPSPSSGLIPLAAFTAVFFRWAAAEHEADDDADVPADERVLRG